MHPFPQSLKDYQSKINSIQEKLALGKALSYEERKLYLLQLLISKSTRKEQGYR